MRLTIITFLLFIATNLFGQDKIIRTNGDTITGYISVIEDDEVKYRRADDRSQPVYTIKKSLVDRVVYENGEVEKFTLTPAQEAAERYNFRHRISWVYTDVFVARMQFAYEYLNKSGSIGIRVPFGAGLNLFNYSGGPTGGEGLGLNVVSGVDLNVYPTTARGMVKYYFGPMVRVGYNKGDIFEGRENVYGAIMFGNGVSVNITKELNMSAYLGVGVKMARYINQIAYYDMNSEPVYTNGYNRVYPHMVFGLTFGYNFGK